MPPKSKAKKLTRKEQRALERQQRADAGMAPISQPPARSMNPQELNRMGSMINQRGGVLGDDMMQMMAESFLKQRGFTAAEGATATATPQVADLMNNPEVQAAMKHYQGALQNLGEATSEQAGIIATHMPEDDPTPEAQAALPPPEALPAVEYAEYPPQPQGATATPDEPTNPFLTPMSPGGNNQQRWQQWSSGFTPIEFKRITKDQRKIYDHLQQMPDEYRKLYVDYCFFKMESEKLAFKSQASAKSKAFGSISSYFHDKCEIIERIRQEKHLMNSEDAEKVRAHQHKIEVIERELNSLEDKHQNARKQLLQKSTQLLQEIEDSFRISNSKALEIGEQIRKTVGKSFLYVPEIVWKEKWREGEIDQFYKMMEETTCNRNEQDNIERMYSLEQAYFEKKEENENEIQFYQDYERSQMQIDVNKFLQKKFFNVQVAVLDYNRIGPYDELMAKILDREMQHSEKRDLRKLVSRYKNSDSHRQILFLMHDKYKEIVLPEVRKENQKTISQKFQDLEDVKLKWVSNVDQYLRELKDEVKKVAKLVNEEKQETTRLKKAVLRSEQLALELLRALPLYDEDIESLFADEVSSVNFDIDPPITKPNRVVFNLVKKKGRQTRIWSERESDEHEPEKMRAFLKHVKLKSLQTIQSLMRLSGHKNVLRYYSCKEAGSKGVYQVVTECYDPHLTLKHCDKMRLRVRPIMIQIFEGLAYLHGNEIYHGNLQPESIVLFKTKEHENYDRYFIKISDFGREWNDTYWKSIEEWSLADKKLLTDAALDIYASGLILYFSLDTDWHVGQFKENIKKAPASEEKISLKKEQILKNITRDDKPYVNGDPYLAASFIRALTIRWTSAEGPDAAKSRIPQCLTASQALQHAYLLSEKSLLEFICRFSDWLTSREPQTKQRYAEAFNNKFTDFKDIQRRIITETPNLFKYLLLEVQGNPRYSKLTPYIFVRTIRNLVIHFYDDKSKIPRTTLPHRQDRKYLKRQEKAGEEINEVAQKLYPRGIMRSTIYRFNFLERILQFAEEVADKTNDVTELTQPDSQYSYLGNSLPHNVYSDV